jgi:hypothetical protein
MMIYLVIQETQKHSYVGMMVENVKNMLIPLGGNVTSLQGFDPSDTYLDN